VFAELLSTTDIATQASAGNTASDSWDDIGFLFSSVTLGARSKPYFVAASDAMKLLASRSASGLQAFPGLGPQGGAIAGVPALASDGLDDGTLVLLDAQQVCAADDGVRLDTTREGLIALDDAPTAGSALTSLWQQDLVGIRVERYFGMQALSSSGLAYVTGIS
jgi:hypothetical protein